MNSKTLDDVYVESLRGSIGMKIGKLKDEVTLMKKWSKGMVSRFRKFIDNNLTDEDFEMLYKEFSAATTAENFSEYIKHYKKIADFCHFNVEGSTIHSYYLKRRKGEDKNQLIVVYALSRKRIVIPNGMGIYHQSNVDNITELNPTFKARKNGLLYSYPRIYFSLRKNIPNFIVDQDGNTTLYVYTPKKKFTTAFIDSAAPWPNQNNVYYETKTPIPVEKIDVKKSKEDLKKEKKSAKKNTTIKESVDIDYLDRTTFETFEDFMEYYNLDYLSPDEDILIDKTITEGFRSAIEDIKNSINQKINDKKDDKILKAKWEDKEKDIKSRNEVKKTLDEKTYKLAKKNREILMNSKSFGPYKRAYNWFAKTFGFSQDNSVIEHITLKEDKSSEPKNKSQKIYKIYLRFCDGLKQITVPITNQLVHMSPVKGIRELTPTFRSKTKGAYFYSSPRVYFVIGKKPLSSKRFGVDEDVKLQKYTPKYDYKFAYIDQSNPGRDTGAVFIDSKLPIPVVYSNEKPMKESVDMCEFFTY